MTPAYDPTSLPAPPGIMLSLFGLTFVAHLGMLALLFAALWARASAEWGRPTSYDASRIHRVGVLGFSLTITLGVPPLLFVQILYGRLFYASSISIGLPWLAIVGYLLVGFYALYLAQWSWERHNGPSFPGKVFWLVTVLCVFAIGFTYAWNHLKSQSAMPWMHDVSHADTGQRLLGYFGAVLTGSAAWAAWLGRKWRADGITPTGSALAATIGGAGLLFWSLLSRYAETLKFVQPLLVVSATVSVFAGVFLLGRFAAVGRWVITISAPLGMLGLVLQRESYRIETVAAFHNPYSELIRPQWGAMVMFALSLLIGIGVLIWLLIKIRAAARPS